MKNAVFSLDFVNRKKNKLLDICFCKHKRESIISMRIKLLFRFILDEQNMTND